MTRYLSIYCLAITAYLVLPVRADVSYEKAKEGDNDIEIVRMTVTPAAEPVPALKYRFVARDIDLKSGNAAPYYYRAELNLNALMKELRKEFDEDTQLSPWYGPVDFEATPIAKLPLEEMRKASQKFDPFYNNDLRIAFERRSCDWELGTEEMHGVEMFSFLLYEVQGCREISRMMALRTRLAIAELRYNDAIELIRNQYRLGRDVAKMPFLVCGLVGVAIGNMANGPLIDLIANRDSPNMYWALSELPRPLIDVPWEARFEFGNLPRAFPFIDRAETTEHAPQEWARLFRQTVRDYSKVGGNLLGGINGRELDDVEAGVGATLLGLTGYAHAKERLIADGMDRERVEKMAVGQVIAIYTERRYRLFCDDFEKLWYVPYADFEKLSNSVENRMRNATPLGTDDDREIFPIASGLIPQIQAARGAQMRLERNMAALRVIEALRMYAAGHDGQLPKALDEITIVPVPLNPATGKKFVYRLNGTTAVLELPPSDGFPDPKTRFDMPSSNRRYEIQIAAKR
jgi:hypothetical protein